MFIEKAEVRIPFSAGASDFEIKGTIEFEHQKDDKRFLYLDFIGRPVVILRKKNIVTQHTNGKPIVIRYNYICTWPKRRSYYWPQLLLP